MALDDVSPAIQMVEDDSLSLLKGAPGWQQAVVFYPPPPQPSAADKVGIVSHNYLNAPHPRRLRTGRRSFQADIIAPALIDWSKDPNVPAILRSVSATLPAPFVFPSDATALAAVQQHFSTAAAAINGYLDTTQAAAADLPSLGGSPALATTRTQLNARLDPAITIQARIKVRVPLNPGSIRCSRLPPHRSFRRPCTSRWQRCHPIGCCREFRASPSTPPSCCNPIRVSSKPTWSASMRSLPVNCCGSSSRPNARRHGSRTSGAPEARRTSLPSPSSIPPDISATTRRTTPTPAVSPCSFTQTCSGVIPTRWSQRYRQCGTRRTPKASSTAGWGPRASGPSSRGIRRRLQVLRLQYPRPFRQPRPSRE